MGNKDEERSSGDNESFPLGSDQSSHKTSNRATPLQIDNEFFEVYGKDIARWAVGKLATSIFGDGIGKALSGPLFNAIGIGVIDTAAQYHQEVMEELGKIEGQIREVQQAVSDVKNAVTVVGNLVSAEALAARLQELELQANVVRTHFGLMANDFAALTHTRERAVARDLFGRLRSPNDTAVAIAMENIGSIMLTTSSANPGVMDRLQTYLRNVMVTYAATTSNYQGAPWSDGTPDGCRVYMDNPIYLGDKLFSGSYDCATNALPIIGKLFRRVLTVQVQGLIFLSAAWKDGPQQPALESLIRTLVQQIALMQDFHRIASDLITRTVLENLRIYGVRPKLRLKGSFVASHNGALPVPLDEAWILWSCTGANNAQFIILRKPWELGSIMTWLLYRNGSAPTWTWVHDGSSPEREFMGWKCPATPPNTTQLPRYDRPAPPEFDFLHSLPSVLPSIEQPYLSASHEEWDPGKGGT